MSRLTSEIRRGAVLSYASVAFNAIAGLLYTPWMVSVIGNDSYGLYTLAISVINFFVMDFGLSDAVSRFLAKYYAEGDTDKANEFLRITMCIYLAISCILAVILLLVFVNIDQIYTSLNTDQLVVFKRLFIVVAMYSVISFPCSSLNGMLGANELFVKLNGCILAQRVLTVTTTIAALLMGAGVYALVVVNAVVGLLFSIIKVIIVRKETTITLRRGPSSGMKIGDILSFSSWTMIIQICQRLMFSVMPSILAMMSSSAEIAIFGLASSLEGYVWMVANALNGMFMPKVTRVLREDSSGDGMQKLSVRVGRIQLLITGAIIISFAVIGTDFVRCWIGPGYPTLYSCTLLLIVPELIELPTMIEGTALLAAGRAREKGMAYIVMAATNVVLSFMLSKSLGAVGACLSISLAYIIRTCLLCVMYKRFLSFRLTSFIRETYVTWTIPAAMTLLIGLFLSRLQLPVGWVGFLCKAIIVAFVYAATSWCFVLNGYEKGQIRTMLHLSSSSE